MQREFTTGSTLYINIEKTVPRLASLGITQIPNLPSAVSAKRPVTEQLMALNISGKQDVVNVRHKFDNRYYQISLNGNPNEPPRSSFMLTDGKSVITFFEKSDRSSFLHEMGHYFLESRRSLSFVDDTPQWFRDDWQTIIDWLGVNDIDFSKDLTEDDAKRWQAAHEK